MTNINSKNRIELDYLLNDSYNFLNLNNKFILLKEYRYNTDILKNIITVIQSDVNDVNINQKYYKKNNSVNEFFIKKSESIENITDVK